MSEFDGVFMEMFGQMFEHRNLAHDEYEDLGFAVDTTSVIDHNWDYEVAIQHKDLNDGNWIIMDWREDAEEALEIHKMYIQMLKEDKFDSIEDVFGEKYYRN